MDTNLRHQCLIYSGAPSEHIAAIGAILKDRLTSGFRCLYLHNPAMVSELRSWLISAGIDLNDRLGSGDLVLACDHDHLCNGEFEIEPMISMLRNEALSSKADGYRGLWASGDMTWEFGSEKNLDKLLEYEYRLEELFKEVPLLHGICQYHMDTLPSTSIHNALCSHQKIFINEALSVINSNYTPKRFVTDNQPTISQPRIQKMLEGLGLPPYPA